jgi:hypothetical protein
MLGSVWVWCERFQYVLLGVAGFAGKIQLRIICGLWIVQGAIAPKLDT